MRRLNMINIFQINKLYLCKVAHDVIHNPNSIFDIKMTFKRDLHPLNTRQASQQHIHSIRSNTSIGHRSISHNVISTWNSLKLTTRQIENKKLFSLYAKQELELLPSPQKPAH
eukprot:Lithocolla_globosa_v1_NODE_1798_length_2330_cov_3.987692.p4 type:complete len:113 gc:universal NODE_1798_length_2330_cov_3.987692:1660-1998(+)